MKKYRYILPAVLLAAAMLGGCGSYKSDTSTIYVKKDGSVITCDVEPFDESVYSQEELESYIKSSISDYTGMYGEKTVSLDRITVKDNVATMIIKYATADDYNTFNGGDLFYGTIAEAKAAGYTFDGNFVSYDGKETALCGVDDFYSEDDLHVVITDQPYEVCVYRPISFVSADDAGIVDKKTITISASAGLLPTGQDGSESVAEGTENTESVAEVVTEEAAAEGTEFDSVSDGSISDDDLLAMAETETQQDFEFEETEEDTTISPVYIIFK